MNKKQLIKYITENPKKILVAFILITIIVGAGLYKIKIDSDIRHLIPETLPSKKIFNTLVDTFGDPDFLMIAIGNKNKNIFNLNTIKKIYKITKDLENFHSIEKVISIVNLKDITADNTGFIINNMFDKEPSSEQEIKNFRTRFMKTKDYVNMFISKDKHFSVIIGILEKNANEKEVSVFLKRIKNKYKNPETIVIGGMPVIRSSIFTSIIDDLLILIPFVILILIIILVFSLRDLTGVRITGFVIGGSVIFTVGLMSWLDIPLKIVTSSLPVILVSIACADSIHLITKYHDYIASGKSKKEAVFLMLDKLLLPVIVTSVTTIAGFLSLTTAVLPALRTYGIFISIGVFWALLLSIFVLPSFLILSNVPKFHKENKKHILDKSLYILSKIILKYRIFVFIIFFIIVVISLFGIKKINIEMNPETFFPSKSIIRTDSKFLSKQFGGSISLNIMIKGDIKSPEVLNNMLLIQKYIEKKSIVGNVRSIADIIRSLHKKFYSNNDEYYRIPKTKNKIAQLLLLYSMSGDSTDFDKYVDYDYRTALIDIRINSSSTKEIKKFVTDVNKFIKKESFKNMKVYLTGTSVFLSELVYLLVKSCLISILISLILIFIIVWISFKSIKLGIYGIIPLSVAVMVDFGLMGILGIDLNHVTAMLSAIAIGVGIDYSIHYIASYNQSLELNLSSADRLTYLITTTGKPILFNAFSVAAGFFILIFSSFLPVKFLGGLISLSMISCAFGALTILALFLYYKK